MNRQNQKTKHKNVLSELSDIFSEENLNICKKSNNIKINESCSLSNYQEKLVDAIKTNNDLGEYSLINHLSIINGSIEEINGIHEIKLQSSKVISVTTSLIDDDNVNSNTQIFILSKGG